MIFFLQQLASGVASGGIYASLALAFVMIYQSTHHINFAQGEMAMFSVFIAAVSIDAGVPYWGAFAIALGSAFLIGVVIQRVIVRPLTKAPVLAHVVLFVGLLVLFNGLAGLLFGHTTRTFQSPFSSDFIPRNRFVSAHEVGLVLVVLVMLGLLYSFFRYTKLGLAMRAAAYNPDSSEYVGIRVGWMLALGWGLGGVFGTISGIMVAPIVFLDPHMMAGVLVYGFAGALLGGINNPWGAAAGGFLVGIIDTLAGAYLFGTELKLTVALVIIVVVLLIKPSGLFGRPIIERV
ncbi:branched-chain amino acid ABC transporter permease [Ferrovibrio sp.]|uniref:branched-chain amino acid ABC transporter permease n=1 Tax=Ferrovibrio sp. TaxID=1917215 RepID=UPI003D10BFD1